MLNSNRVVSLGGKLVMSIDVGLELWQWYAQLDKGQRFRVVAIDEADELIEIQHFDGNVEEIDFDTWIQLEIEPIEAPEDWTGPIDDVERDDLGYTETEMDEEDWNAPLREVRQKEEKLGGDDREEQDDWCEGHPKEEQWDGEK